MSGAAPLVVARPALIRIALIAVFGPSVFFAGFDLVTPWSTGSLIHLWCCLAGALGIAFLWFWYHQDSVRRGSATVQMSAAIALLTILLYFRYGMDDSIIWLFSLVGFAAALMGTRREAWIWSAVVFGCVVAATLFATEIQIPDAAGETPLGIAMAQIVFTVVLLGIAFGFRIVIERHTLEMFEAKTQAERSNAELESFSYSVSHDLRAPLRGIDGFSQALLEDYSDRLDDDGQDYLKRVRSSAQRMGQLIDDMLELSRMTRSDMRDDEVDLSAMAGNIAGGLREGEPHRQVDLSISPDLVVRGDPTLLGAVLSNLLGNAWKFTAGKEDARIELGIEESEKGKAYFVRDNGAGFDMAYAGKLFGTFQRLHKTTEFPGTGVGLAIVQRAVHRHGGRVWGTGEVDKGATFHFTLPQQSKGRQRT